MNQSSLPLSKLTLISFCVILLSNQLLASPIPSTTITVLSYSQTPRVSETRKYIKKPIVSPVVIIKEITKPLSLVAPDIMVPHQADYTVELEDNNNPDVYDIKGWMNIQLLNSGDGYDTRQTSNLMIYNNTGNADQLITKLKTWESYDATRFIFECQTLQNGAETESFKGSLQRSSLSSQAQVHYTDPNPSSAMLEQGIFLPMQLIQHLIAFAKQNDQFPKTLTVLVFDGTSEAQEPVKVDAVIHRRKEPKIILNENSASQKYSFQPQNAYPVDLAIYSVNNDRIEPDYRIHQVILDSGILKEMSIIRDGYTVKATLSNLTFFNIPQQR